MTAEAVLAELRALARPEDRDRNARFYAGADPETRILGVRMGDVFAVAKAQRDLPLNEVATLLSDPHYEVRMAAVAILDVKARRKGLTAPERAELLAAYLDNHDRIDNWDLVDRAAPWVVGEALVEGDRSLLDRLAASPDPSRRRTAIVATHAFLKRGETADTFRIAEHLAEDPDPYVQKALGSWLREAGKRDPAGRDALLARLAGRLPQRTARVAAAR